MRRLRSKSASAIDVLNAVGGAVKRIDVVLVNRGRDADHSSSASRVKRYS